MKRFKEEQRKVKVLSRDELARLLSAPNTATKEGKRDAAILRLFFSTGLRLAELRSLNRKDLNFQTRESPSAASEASSGWSSSRTPPSTR